MMRVLVLDDDPFIQKLVSVRLEHLGFQVAGADDGSEALAILETDVPDILFLDISMPKVSGLEVLDSVRQRRLDLAVVIMTAFGSESTALEALRRGADEYLRKPFEPVEFQAVVQRTVARLSLIRQNARLQKQLDEELAQAAVIQAEFLPKQPLALPGFEAAAYFHSARRVSGEFYDWHPIGGELYAFVLGEVTGKGLPAALLMSSVRAALRAVAGERSAGEVIERVIPVLMPDLKRSAGCVTLFYAHLHVAEKRLTYIAAGHVLGSVLRASGASTPLEICGLPVGISADERYHEHVIDFAPGDTLILYSDGLHNAGAKLQSPSDALLPCLHGVLTVQDVVERLVERIAPVDAWQDDVTILALRCIEK